MITTDPRITLIPTERERLMSNEEAIHMFRFKKGGLVYFVGLPNVSYSRTSKDAFRSPFILLNKPETIGNQLKRVLPASKRFKAAVDEIEASYWGLGWLAPYKAYVGFTLDLTDDTI
jgi:hypothetical protein